MKSASAVKIFYALCLSPILAFTFALATDCAPASKSLVPRKLIFPDSFKVGNLYALDSNWTPTIEHSHGPMIGRAQGVITVPATKKLMLILNENFNAYPDSLKELSDDALVDLHGGSTEVNDRTIYGLLNLKGLKRLELDDTEIGDASLAKISTLNNLEYLDCHSTKITGSGISKLQNLKKLKTLIISNNKLFPTAFADLAALRGITYLNVCRSNLNDAGVKELSTLSALTRLELSDNKDVTRKSLLYLKAFFHLNHLDIRNLNFSVADLSLLKGAKIETLTVSAQKFSPREKELLKQELLPIIVRLECPERKMYEEILRPFE